MWLAVLGFMVMRLVSGLSLTNYLDSRSFLVVDSLFSQDGCVRGVCNFLGFISLLQKFEVTDQCYSPQMDQCYSSMLQLSFIQKVKENTSSRHEGLPTQKMRREERPPAQFWLLFLYVFSSPQGLPSENWASQKCCWFYLRSSLQSSDLPLFYFHGLFPSFQPLPFWTPFSYS